MVCVSKSSLILSLNLTNILALGQSQPVEIACFIISIIVSALLFEILSIFSFLSANQIATDLFSYEYPFLSNISSICFIMSFELFGICIIIKGFIMILLFLYSCLIAFLFSNAKSSKYSCSFSNFALFVTFSFIYNALVISPSFITSNSSICINSASLFFFVVADTLTI